MLDYLFVAETNDGIIEQDQLDESQIVRGKSRFYDVLQAHVKKFSLVGKGHIFSIDLTDGHYEIDGKTFYTKTPPTNSELKLIYYRQVEQKITSDFNTLTPTTRYFIGWQANHRGKNYKFELGVD